MTSDYVAHGAESLKQNGEDGKLSFGIALPYLRPFVVLLQALSLPELPPWTTVAFYIGQSTLYADLEGCMIMQYSFSRRRKSIDRLMRPNFFTTSGH